VLAPRIILVVTEVGVLVARLIEYRTTEGIPLGDGPIQVQTVPPPEN